MKFKWVMIAGIGVFLWSSCHLNQGDNPLGRSEETVKPEAHRTTYTCPMHHQIRTFTPGKCPVCGMTLVPVDRVSSGGAIDSAVELTIPPRQQLLAGIRIDTVHSVLMNHELVLLGTTMLNPGLKFSVSAPVSGWIEKMYVLSPGARINAGDKLYDLYSPDLLATERDYQSAIRQDSLFKETSADVSATIQAMKNKLSRWGLSQDEIKHLEEGPTPGVVSVHSRSQGYLFDRQKKEGDFVKEGEMILDLAGNQTLWVQAQLYERELPLLTGNPEIRVAIDGMGERRLSGKIVFNNPVTEKGSRVHLLNIVIPNPDGQIQSGMLARVYLITGGLKKALVVPKSAVVYDTKKHYVWIALPGNVFRRREVILGDEHQEDVQILSGVDSGALVVGSGSYLVQSDYTLKYGSGVNLSGMQMSDMQMSGKGN